MHLQTTEIFLIIGLGTFMLLLAPLFVLRYISVYNSFKNKDLEEKLDMTQNFQTQLVQTKMDVAEHTKQSIAADLHDNIGQLLGLTALTLGSVRLDENENTRKKIDDSLELLHKAIKEVRDLTKVVHGGKLVEMGLGHALQEEFDRFKRMSGLKVKIKNNLIDKESASPEKDLIILRLLQEITNNIIKHAFATKIEFYASIENESLQLIIIENGVGFEYQKTKNQNKGFGIYSIHKRVNVLNGNIVFRSKPEAGTKIAITIPYP